jgi:hypothetical protein
MGNSIVVRKRIKSAERTCYILNNTTHSPHVPALSHSDTVTLVATLPCLKRQVIPVPIEPVIGTRRV